MLVSSYNSIVAKSEEVDNKYATIDTYLQRRADLIPNLVNTVKGYTKQEQDIINSITDARANLLKPENLELIKFVDNYFIVCRNNKTETLSKQLKTIEATNEETEDLYKKAIVIFNKTNNENING